MTIRNKLKYFLVHDANYTNKEANELIASGNVKVNEVKTNDNIIITPQDTISINDKIVRTAVKHEYILFYKPVDIETTHNPKIEHSLVNHFPALKHLFFAGRLDKDSEGLLLMTSDGKFANELAHPFNQKEKEYIVIVDKPITHTFVKQMADGVTIMGYKTNSCEIKKLSEDRFNIILKEGKNRQIRRMCYKLGYNVLSLKRIRIDQWKLNDLKPGEWISIKKEEGF
ncbi:MAG: pseudouridine synthase [Bacteroidetes bacterium]|nr:pseudouridine synthase [Bacteroidota bacterium]